MQRKVEWTLSKESIRLDLRFVRDLGPDERKAEEDSFRTSRNFRKSLAKVLTKELNSVILKEESVDLSEKTNPVATIAADRARREVYRSIIKLILPEEHDE